MDNLITLHPFSINKSKTISNKLNIYTKNLLSCHVNILIIKFIQFKNNPNI